VDAGIGGVWVRTACRGEYQIVHDADASYRPPASQVGWQCHDIFRVFRRVMSRDGVGPVLALRPTPTRRTSGSRTRAPTLVSRISSPRGPRDSSRSRPAA